MTEFILTNYAQWKLQLQNNSTASNLYTNIMGGFVLPFDIVDIENHHSALTKLIV